MKTVRIQPQYQIGDIVVWGANRHRILSAPTVSVIAKDDGELKVLGVYYQVQAIEGRCAFHKPIQAAEDVLSPASTFDRAAA